MDAVSINQYLKRWGLTPNGDPLVRLVWSDDQRELRRGTFNEFYGDIFLRTVTGVKEVPKYSWISECWILERWFPPAAVQNPELVESHKGSYEPIYIFQDVRGNALPLNIRVVELICSAMFNQPPTSAEIKQAIDDGLAAQDRVETAYFEDALEMSVIANQLHQREAIIVPRKVN